MKRRLRNIVIAFSISFLLMAALAFFSIERFYKFMSYSNQVDHTNEVMRTIYRLEGYIKDLDRVERGYMIGHDTALLRTLNRNIDSVGPLLNTLKNLTADNAQEQKNIILLKSAVAMRVNAIHSNIKYLNDTNSASPSSYYLDGRKATSECSRTLRTMHSEENTLFLKRVSNEQLYQKLASSSFEYLLFLFFALTLGLFLLMILELRKRVRYQHELQSKVHDLKRSHSELEQIAYVASHDLQEPLRKIQIFSNRLLFLKKDNIDDESKGTMERISVSATRMQELVEDLVNLTSLIKEHSPKELLDMNRTLRHAINELEDKITKENATISYNTLPHIKGYASQLQILFKALLDNSLKFTREGVAPVISIQSEEVEGTELKEIHERLAHKKFIRITITDNGIGFDNKFTYKMFKIFQRLHNSSDNAYEGKGIGLAICQRIMTNHEGYILGYGHVSIGATFKLFFPVEE